MLNKCFIHIIYYKCQFNFVKINKVKVLKNLVRYF